MNHNHHNHDSSSNLTFHEKTIKMLEHWIKHNQDHAENYNKWAKETKDNFGTNISDLLKDAADLTLSINGKFEAAIKLLKEVEK